MDGRVHELEWAVGWAETPTYCGLPPAFAMSDEETLKMASVFDEPSEVRKP